MLRELRIANLVFDVRRSEVLVGRLLKKHGFSLQRPKLSAFQQDELLVEWMAKNLIVNRMQKFPLAISPWSDPTTTPAQHGAPRGKTPVIITTGARNRVNLILCHQSARPDTEGWDEITGL